MNAAISFLNSILWHLIPPTRAFALKRKLLRLAGAEVGENVRCASSVRTFVGGASEARGKYMGRPRHAFHWRERPHRNRN